MKEKLTNYFIWCCLAIALILLCVCCGFIGRLTYDKFIKSPDKSKEVIVLVKDSVETQKLRSALAKLQQEADRYWKESEKTKKYLTNKIKQNENNKETLVAVDDSIAIMLLDSLRAAYKVRYVHESAHKLFGGAPQSGYFDRLIHNEIGSKH